MDYSSDSITAHVFHYFTNDKRSDANLENTAVLVSEWEEMRSSLGKRQRKWEFLKSLENVPSVEEKKRPFESFTCRSFPLDGWAVQRAVSLQTVVASIILHEWQTAYLTEHLWTGRCSCSPPCFKVQSESHWTTCTWPVRACWTFQANKVTRNMSLDSSDWHRHWQLQE